MITSSIFELLRKVTGNTALNNITSSPEAKNDCSKISSNEDIVEIKFLREELKNKITIIKK